MAQRVWKTTPSAGTSSGTSVRRISVDWLNLFGILFSGLFLVSFIHWFSEEDGGFLPKTVLLLYWTLGIVFVTEAARARNRFLHRVLQFVLLLVFFGIALGYTPIWEKPKTVGQFGQLFLENAEQLYPYLWFGMGTWILYLFTIWWMKSKKRIAIALILGVLAMALRDSFSLVYLWDEAAWLILCGLFLLVIRHFGSLRDKSPDNWGYIADYPISSITPIVLLLTITVGAGTLAPDVNNVLTDPYTLYMRWEGEPVTVPGKLKELASPILPTTRGLSGYSRDDSGLGGGFDYDYATVFTVETSHRSYWRGETKEVYTGSGWQDSRATRTAQMLDISGKEDAFVPDSRLDLSKRKTVEVKQTITFLEKSPKYDIAFGAFELSSLTSVNNKDTGFDAAWRSPSAELLWGEGGRPKTYTVTSEMPILDENGLRKSPMTYPEKAQLGTYLAVPDSLPERVRTLAADITKEASDPYSKAKALETYLQTTFPYNNKPDESNSSSKDFVDRFLFETLQGYCDYYSTAMAVMARTIGLPTRWVKGYSSGASPFDEMTPQEIMGRLGERDPNGAGTYTVHNSNAHSWVEVYFSGYGWIPFDPTSGFVVPYADDPSQPTKEPVQPEQASEPSISSTNDSSGISFGGWTFAGLGVLAAAGLVFWYAAGIRRGRWTPVWLKRMIAASRPEPNYDRLLVKEFERVLRVFRRRGFPVLEHETARETVDRWRQKDSWLSSDLEKLLALFEKAKYSPRSVTEEEAARAAGLSRKLRKDR
ncbi:transglutaminase domain-containing protein [Gorillibacterium sp. CAU 1737]|uniref:DUF4129 domain-containing transglutaminase family protein n=1 Tax=Gorillibacterium sp. CAU 1737 TaxID=3140362 RepID=UPI003260175B